MNILDMLQRLDKRIMAIEKALKIIPPAELLLHPKSWRQYKPPPPAAEQEKQS